MSSAATTHRIDLTIGPVEYADIGSGPTLVFVHGVFAAGALWSKVVAALHRRFRCVVPTFPLGGHRLPANPHAERTPHGLADAVIELMEKLDLHDVTLVGNDTGGAICQLVVARRPERVTRLALTNCDAFEAFPPRVLWPLYALASVPGGFWCFAHLLRLRVMQRAFFASVTRAVPDDASLRMAFAPFIGDVRVRDDVRQVMRAVSARDTLAAAETFATFERPVLVAWGTKDLFFPVALGERLANAFPQGRLQLVEGARTFVSEDAPMVLAAALDAFVAPPPPV
ncbi:MAG: alpha/beta fold hydrolase [Vulcanimicrobiaceae bacterium]